MRIDEVLDKSADFFQQNPLVWNRVGRIRDENGITIGSCTWTCFLDVLNCDTHSEEADPVVDYFANFLGFFPQPSDFGMGITLQEKIWNWNDQQVHDVYEVISTLRAAAAAYREENGAS